MGIEQRFEYATSENPSLNYCLWPYQAPAPAEDKFRSINLLYQTFAFAGIDAGEFAIVDAIRDGIGAFKTVFGVKLAGARLGSEVVFLRLQAAAAGRFNVTRVAGNSRLHADAHRTEREFAVFHVFAGPE